MHLRRPTNVPAFTVLQNRDFRAIWYMGGIHEMSRRMELFVLSLLILQTTDSLFQLGLVLVFNNLPRPFFALFAGLVADRFSRLRILVIAQTINTLVAFAIFVLIITHAIASWHVFLAVFMQGLTKALDDPSRRTAILDIVGAGQIVNALSLDQISNTIGKMSGPLLGGVLLSASGFPGAYVLVLGMNLITLGLLTRVRIPSYQRVAGQMEPVWRSLSTSLKHAFKNPVLLGMLYVTIVMNALAFPVQQFIPAIGRDHLLVGPALIGLLVSAEGVGQFIGAGVMASTRNLQRHGRVFMIGSTLVLLMAILFVWSPWYVMAFAVLTVGGIGQAAFGTMQSSITMLSAPRELRGRMLGLMSFCIGVGTPLGTLEIGAVATAFGAPWAISVNALAGLLLLLPAALTPLVSRPTVQPEPATAQD
ncbi:MAG: MFS transporter [Chloroflexi bacterium]|nr:MFS transporter [Chloroflexota bacterium]MDA1219858.1 MFS transporter [Chloroflexota bacterium]